MAKMSSFKLQQTKKRVAATIDDSAKRREYLAMMIQAQKIHEHFQNSRSRDRSTATTESAGSE